MVAIISILNLIDFNYTTPSGHAIGLVVMIMAVITMTVGNVMGLLQRNLKRLFAYSSIAHSGYMLVGLVAMNGLASPGDGVTATIFYTHQLRPYEPGPPSPSLSTCRAKPTPPRTSTISPASPKPTLPPPS